MDIRIDWYRPEINRHMMRISRQTNIPWPTQRPTQGQPKLPKLVQGQPKLVQGQPKLVQGQTGPRPTPFWCFVKFLSMFLRNISDAENVQFLFLRNYFVF